MRPEKGDEECAVRSSQCRGETRFVVDIGCHNLCARGGEFLCGSGVDVARDGAHCEASARFRENGTHKTTALRTGRAHDCDHSGFSHW